ncbi:MAG: transporter substrate-binding domain-containing protein [Campylobacteraceae bacterium]|nr:transporter substrate-binding domain-containing protein [Campylobacteraceae bacterium]
MSHVKFLLIILFLAFLSNVYAKPLQLVTLEYPPYEYTEDGKLKGMAVEVVKIIFKEMNEDITIEVLPWARAIRYIEDGSRDAIFTAYKNPVREKFADYSTEILMPQIVSFFVKKGSSIVFDGDFNALSQYSMGVVRKISYGQKLDLAIKNKIFKRVENANDVTQNFRKLIKGRIDIIPNSKYGGYHILKKLNQVGEVDELPVNIQSVPSFIAFSKKRNLKDIRDKFDVILKRLKKDGTYLQILQNYSKK